MQVGACGNQQLHNLGVAKERGTRQWSIFLIILPWEIYYYKLRHLLCQRETEKERDSEREREREREMRKKEIDTKVLISHLASINFCTTSIRPGGWGKLL